MNEDTLATLYFIGVVLFLLIFFSLIPIAVYTQLFAPCDSWLVRILSVKDVPSRCVSTLNITIH